MGWISCISVFMFFSKLFCFFLFFLFSLRGGSWAGYPVFMFLCFSRSVSEAFFARCLFLSFFCMFFFLILFYLFSCFRLVYLSFCLNTTQYITLNTQTNKHEMGLFMTCVKCSKTPKYQNSNATNNTKSGFVCAFA